MRGDSQDLINKTMDLYATGNNKKTELAKLLSLGYATIRRWGELTHKQLGDGLLNS